MQLESVTSDDVTMRRQTNTQKEWKWQQLMRRQSLPEELQAKAWEGFAEGNWQKDIDVRDFIQKNYTPYEGDESFLADATEKTKHLWQYLDDNYLAVERKQRVYDVDTHTPAGIERVRRRLHRFSGS